MKVAYFAGFPKFSGVAMVRKTLSMRGAIASIGVAMAISAATVQATTLAINGTANIFGAGHSGGSATPAPGGSGGGTAPPSFIFLAGPNQVITFSSVTGQVTCCTVLNNGPDGGTFAGGVTDITSFNGIAGIQHDNKTMFLVGVFTSNTEPVDPAPPRLHFSDAGGGGTMATSFFDVFVQLDQPFFIGDGLTGTGSGSTQNFHVPNGATHLYFGFADGNGFSGAPGSYIDNAGTLSATFDLTTAAAPEPASLALLGLGLLGLGVTRRRSSARRTFAR